MDWIIAVLVIIVFMAAVLRVEKEHSILIGEWANDHGFTYFPFSDESAELATMLKNDSYELLNKSPKTAFNILIRRWDGVSVRICEYAIHYHRSRKRYCFVVIESGTPITWTAIRSVLPELPLRTEIALDKRRSLCPRCVQLDYSEVRAVFPMLPPKTVAALDSRRIAYRCECRLANHLNSLLAEAEYLRDVLLKAASYPA